MATSAHPVVRDTGDETVREVIHGCGKVLHHHTLRPPVPRTFYGWTDPDDGERWLTFCPVCDDELPDGPLKEVAS